jgi:cyanophycinase-like exopeptidase
VSGISRHGRLAHTLLVASEARLLVIIGSGELAPGMRRVHRAVIARLAGARGDARTLAAVAIDTPYGFQENAGSLTAETLDYFARLGLDMAVASLRRADVDALVRAKALARIRAADYVFSGPGSPTYALRQWRETAIPGLLADKLRSGGALVVASAAALTLGRFTVPVYEIYKTGADPFWADGLDVLSRVGLDAAVVPHWDNREGGDHDTRYCFLGEGRLQTLEARLPASTFILGVDEHTALIVDLGEERASVRGRGAVTVRHGGQEAAFPAGSDVALAELRTAAGLPAREATTRPAPASRRASRTIEGDSADLARRVLQLEAEIGRLGERAELVEPLVGALVEVRAAARAAGNWTLADEIRDRLNALGVELADDADGATAFRLPHAQ